MERKVLTKKLLAGLIVSVIITGGVTGTLYANTDDDILQGTWKMPNESDIPDDARGDMIRYGKELIVNTPKYLGPGSPKPVLNSKLSCASCHLDAGTKPNAIPLYTAVHEYAPPGKYNAREGINLTVEGRIDTCFERSLNGKALPQDSYETQSMKAYMEWLATGITPGVAWQDVKGQETPVLPLLDRAADPAKGKVIFSDKCAKCHGANGQGEWDESKGRYKYPALWGDYSFNTGAGMHRNITATRFVKANMPYGDPSLTLEEAYDVVAYLNSQQRPQKANLELDWSGLDPNGQPNIKKKAVDAAYGPYYPEGMFSPEQHKYGPWQPIMDAVKAQQ
ncbi:c-type cytochrome [Effusibacillus lacus]|uniref:Cytochrome C n=1 Tax=Effusibacillus lacus TaxID=1348429 RepID=A0A292YN76_9BACL|nr:c-type cytochrome [Effusibacillus lacus]TCS72076.1 thiosulfate dehydrogenase [Effusibacillus lacus]GAX90361.1 cytochrome C [Effusibacillus lacus]